MNEETLRTLRRWYRIAQSMQDDVQQQRDPSRRVEAIDLKSPEAAPFLASAEGQEFLRRHQRVVAEVTRDPVDRRVTDELRDSVGELFTFMAPYRPIA